MAATTTLAATINAPPTDGEALIALAAADNYEPPRTSNYHGNLTRANPARGTCFLTDENRDAKERVTTHASLHFNQLPNANVIYWAARRALLFLASVITADGTITTALADTTTTARALRAALKTYLGKDNVAIFSDHLWPMCLRIAKRQSVPSYENLFPTADFSPAWPEAQVPAHLDVTDLIALNNPALLNDQRYALNTDVQERHAVLSNAEKEHAWNCPDIALDADPHFGPRSRWMEQSGTGKAARLPPYTVADSYNLRSGNHFHHDPATGRSPAKMARSNAWYMPLVCYMGGAAKAAGLGNSLPEHMPMNNNSTAFAATWLPDDDMRHLLDLHGYQPHPSMEPADTQLLGYVPTVSADIPDFNPAPHAAFLPLPPRATIGYVGAHVLPNMEGDPFGAKFMCRSVKSTFDGFEERSTRANPLQGRPVLCTCDTCIGAAALHDHLRPSGMVNVTVAFQTMDLPLHWILSAVVLFFRQPLLSYAYGGAVIAVEKGGAEGHVHLQIFADTRGVLVGKTGTSRLTRNLKEFLFTQATTRGSMKRLVDKKVHITAVTINQNKNDLHNFHGALGYLLKDARLPHYQLFVIGDAFTTEDFRVGLQRYKDYGRGVQGRGQTSIIRPTNFALRLNAHAIVSYPNHSIPNVAKMTFDMMVAKCRVVSTDFARNPTTNAINPYKMELILLAMRDPSKLSIQDTTYLFYDTAYPLAPPPYNRTAATAFRTARRIASESPAPDGSGSDLDINTPARRRRPPPAHDDDDGEEPNLMCSEQLEDASELAPPAKRSRRCLFIDEEAEASDFADDDANDLDESGSIRDFIVGDDDDLSVEEGEPSF